MKIELKNTDFKYLYEWLENNINSSIPIYHIIHQQLKPQYEKAFLKYKDEKQKFKIGDRVKFGKGNYREDGVVISVSRLANGKFRYEIGYSYIGDIDEYGNGKIYQTSTYLTAKNIEKL